MYDEFVIETADAIASNKRLTPDLRGRMLMDILLSLAFTGQLSEVIEDHIRHNINVVEC